MKVMQRLRDNAVIVGDWGEGIKAIFACPTIPGTSHKTILEYKTYSRIIKGFLIIYTAQIKGKKENIVCPWVHNRNYENRTHTIQHIISGETITAEYSKNIYPPYATFTTDPDAIFLPENLELYCHTCHRYNDFLTTGRCCRLW